MRFDRVLAALGDRVRPGVYECRLTKAQLDHLCREAEACCPDVRTGTIRMYPIHQQSEKQVNVYGAGCLLADTSFFLV